jgi:hypothetical protein
MSECFRADDSMLPGARGVPLSSTADAIWTAGLIAGCGVRDGQRAAK